MASKKDSKEKDIVEVFMRTEVADGADDADDAMVIDDNEIHQSENLEVVSWGRGDFAALFRTSGEENHSDFELEPLKFHGSRRIIQIASNSYHSAALTSTGELYTCGSNDEGQVNPYPDEDGEIQLFLPKPKIFDSIGRHRISALACGLNHTVCITATGSAISFGGNECGQLGHSPKQFSKVLPRVVEFRWNGKAGSNTSHILQNVACGDLFTLFLTASGEVYSCGVGENTGRIANENSHCAERVDGMVGLFVSQIAAGSSHALALTSRGELFGWGSNSSGQLGLGDDNLTSSGSVVKLPTSIPISARNEDIFVGITAGYAHSLIWSRSGLLFCSGANKYGQLGLASQVRVTTFSEVPVSWGCCRLAVCGAYHSLVLMQSTNEVIEAKQLDTTVHMDYKVFGWGWNNFGQVSSSAPSIVREALELHLLNGREILYLAAGGEQSFAIGLQSCRNSSLMNRQFSTLASRALLPVDAGFFISMTEEIMDKEPKINSNPSLVLSTSNLKELLAAVQDIFSSPTILAASFMALNSNRLQLDVLGIEESYKVLLRVPSGGVVLSRLLQAAEQALGDVLQMLQGTNESTVPDQMLRFLIILWQCPGLAMIHRTSSLFAKMLQLLRLLTSAQRALLLETLAGFPQHIFASRILKPLQGHLSHFIADNGHNFQPKSGNSIFQSASEYSAIILLVCNLLRDLFQMNNSHALLVPNAAFYNDTISDIPEDELVQEFLTWRKSANVTTLQLCHYPFLMSLACKRRLLSALVQVEQNRAQQAAAHLALGLRQVVFMPYFLLSVRRTHLVHDALSALAMADDLTLKKPLKVSFDSEEGIDEGGVRKEFFQLITAQLLAPEYALFVPSNDGGRTLWLNRGNDWSSSEEWELLGKLLGLAVYNGVLLDLHLPAVLYKKLLGLPVGFDDLVSLDPSLHAGLKQLLEYEPAEDVEDVFCRTFEYEWEDLGFVRKVQLIPNGDTCPVTHANRAEYVRLLSTWLLADSLETQFKHLLAGFHRVVHSSALSLLRADELELLMAGLPHLNFHELQAGTSYVCGDASIGWGPDHPTVQAFWEVVHSLELEQKQRLLLFATGSAKAPIGGLRQVALQIQRMCPDTDLLPTAHTCFNMLMLPQYSDKNKLRDRLLLAINECEGFGLK